MRRIAVIGGGPAGIALAIWACRLGIEPVLFEGRSGLGGQLLDYSLPVTDLPGCPSTSAKDLVERLSDDLHRLKVPLHYNSEVLGWDGEWLDAAGKHRASYDWAFYAPGLKPRRLEIAGEDWAYKGSVSDLVDIPESEQILVIGAGDRAVEGAIRLARRGHRVTLACRSRRLRARLSYQKQLVEAGVTVLRETVVNAIASDAGRLIADGRGPQGRAWQWSGSHILVRIGMQPAVTHDLALVAQDLAYPRQLRMTIIGDAAVPAWQRSLVTAFASAMQAVKWYVSHADR
ncbi:MAG: NAD(P)/FAD-dependent oxidoreductase [Sulfobacillus acidophilus]|uniref:NAD(P)/FAD-dependent oxidoreductase n=1 Tax=Sulfobacillus acidophilus TaxID=53633 RepID=A0A2T2WLL7_9FIRM|nr:MAG: NAD(P)/FAD-dependent oxidoreductase [Sulfobacillus acidophilus]